MELVNENICCPKHGNLNVTITSIEQKISKLLCQWAALQIAVKNQWGGRNSLKKSQELASDIFTWLFHSEECLQVEDLENLLHERLLLTFNTEIEDGSIEEIAEQLMIIREEHLQQNSLTVQAYKSSFNQKAQWSVEQNLGRQNMYY